MYDGWILSHVRKPDEGQNVITYANQNPLKGYAEDFFINGKFSSEMGTDRKVTHWAPKFKEDEKEVEGEE